MRFAAYPKYKRSGIEWLGDVPDHWEAKRLRHICRFAYGDALTLEDRSEGDVPAYGSNGSFGSYRIPNSRKPVIVVGRKGSYGKVNYSEQAVFASDTTYYIDERYTSNDLRWLFYFLGSVGLDAASKDSAVPGLAREDAYEHYGAVPPFTEQRSIADFLDAQTAKVDTLVTRKRTLIERLKEKRSALISRTITRGFLPAGNRAAGLDANSPLRSSGVESLGSIPVHWEVKPLMHLTDQNRPIMYGIVLPGPDVDDGVPIVKGGDVKPGRLSLESLCRTTFEIEAGYVRSRLRENDIVFSIRGSIGEAELVPAEVAGANLTQDAARIAHGKSANFKWLLYALKARTVIDPLMSLSLGAAVRGINIRDLKRVKLPVPSSHEQKAIAKYLDQETARIDKMIAKVEAAIERLREYRAALITAAVTGKIDVRKAAA